MSDKMRELCGDNVTNNDDNNAVNDDF